MSSGAAKERVGIVDTMIGSWLEAGEYGDGSIST